MNSTNSTVATGKGKGLRFLHLKNVVITFKQQIPRYPIKVKITYGESVAASREFERIDAEVLRWEVDTYLSKDSSFLVTIKESQRIKWRPKRDFASISFEGTDIGDIGKNEDVSKDNDKGSVTVKLTFEPSVKASTIVRIETDEAVGLLEKKTVALEKLGRARKFVEVVKKFGDVIGDLHPAAKAAVNAFDMLYEKLEEQKSVHKDASDLIDDLQELLPFTEVIDPKMMNEAANSAVKDFLIVFKEACDFIVQYSSKGVLGDLLSDQGSKVNSLKSRFRKAKSKYDWSIKTDVWKVNLKIEKIRENDLLKHLRVSSAGPAGKEFYRTDQCCLEGTRAKIIDRISQWAENSPDRKLFWLHAPPGSGKSAISNSVARIFDGQRMLAGCFFCNRDEPDLLDASRIIPSIAAHLATWHQPYSAKLLSTLNSGEGNKLASKTLQEQFDVLIKGPLLALDSDEQSKSPVPLVLVIDDLDACGRNRGQRLQLAKILVQVSKLVPWLKVFVASRTLPEIKSAFEASYDLLEQLDLGQEEDPTEDILKYAHYRARQVAQENGLDEDWIREEDVSIIIQKSQGRFVWISTVFDFIQEHSDFDHGIQVVLSASTINFETGDRDVAALCRETLRNAQFDILAHQPS